MLIVVTFVLGIQVKTSNVQVKDCTRIDPIHMLLFGGNTLESFAQSKFCKNYFLVWKLCTCKLTLCLETFPSEKTVLGSYSFLPKV